MGLLFHSQTDKEQKGERRTVAFKNKTGITRRERDAVQEKTDTGQREKKRKNMRDKKKEKQSEVASVAQREK